MGLIVLLLVPLVSGFEIEDYPEMFFHSGDLHVAIVVGDNDAAHAVLAQSAIAQDLAEKAGSSNGIAAKLASEVDNLDQDLIVIGDPCKNELLQQLIAPTPCDVYAIGSDGVIEVLEHGAYAHLFLAGTSPEAIRSSAQVLIDQTTYRLQGQRVDFVFSNKTDAEDKPIIEQIDTKKLRDQLIAQLLALQAEKQNQTANLPQKPTNVTPPTCDGCMFNGVCYPQFTIQETQYCDGGWNVRKEYGESCFADLECLSELCSVTCISQEVQPTSLWHRLISWLSSLFANMF